MAACDLYIHNICSLIGRFLGKFMWFCGFSDCGEQFYLLKNRNNESYRLRRSFGIEKAQNVPIRDYIMRLPQQTLMVSGVSQ